MNSLTFKSMYFEVTYACNQKCMHCFIDCGPHRNICEMSAEECLRVIDRFKEQGGEHIFFTGGEPLIRKDMYQLLEYANQKKLKFGISSNGILLSKDVLAKISALKGLQFVLTSLLSLDENSHNSMAQNNLSYKRFMENMMSMRDLDQYVYVQVTLPKDRFCEMEKIADTLISMHQNITIKYTPISHVGVKKDPGAKKLIVPNSHFEGFMITFDKVKTKYGDKIDSSNLVTLDNLKQEHEKMSSEKLYNCASGNLVVRPNGDKVFNITGVPTWTFGKAFDSCLVDVDNHLLSYVRACKEITEEIIRENKGRKFIDLETYDDLILKKYDHYCKKAHT